VASRSKTKERREKRRAHVEHAVSELNLVPYLDVMVNIIMFLLLTVTSWVQFGIVNATLPFYGQTTGSGPKNPDEEERLDLTVLITDKGFTLAGRGGVLGGATGQGPTLPCPTQPCRIVRTPDRGDIWNYDYGKLSEKVAEIKKTFPKEDIVTISGAPTIPYEVVVGVWDAVRGTRDKPLFHKVLFGPEVR
jgi:biopolymer transport protein ExbD